MSKDSIKIKIIFNGKNLTVDVSKNKPFKILREKAHAFFYPLPQSYSFYEKKIELNTVEDKLLGDIFGTRNLIILTIKETNSSYNKLNTNKMLCKECVENQGTNEIAYYCRDCNSFICKNCRLNSESGQHYNHSIIQLFDNNDNKGTKRNVELYKQLLMNDINLVKTKINKCMAINNNKVDFSTLKKSLFEKVLLIGKLLYKKNEEIEKFCLALHGVPLINKSHVEKTCTYWIDKDGTYYMNTLSLSKGVPLADKFNVETNLEFHPYMNNTKTVFRAYVRTNIIKWTLFKMALISQGKKSFSQEIDKWFKFIEEKGNKIIGNYCI